ncbi:fibronectin type III-like domain-contianing protein [Bacteroides salyersiae]|nr:fibronectin type III-like domain-contianing protein [Bacteroides salyersiae]
MSSTDFGEELYVTVDVKNTGKVAGKEIVQLYLSAPQSDIDKPVKELRAFVKTKMLQAGETQTVYMRLTARDLASFNPNVGCWVADKGTYGVSVGASVSDIRVKASFVLPQNITIEKVNNVLNCKSDLKELRR